MNANWDPIWSNYDNSTANPPYGFGTKSNGEIMLNNGSATANDIEMVLYSFLENKMQSFTFQSKNQPLSKAIRDKRPVYYKPSDTNYYYYDRINNSFVIIGSINDFIKWR